MSGTPAVFSRLQKKAQKLRRLEHERARRKIRSVRREFYASLWEETAQRLQLKYERTAPNAHRLAGPEHTIDITGGQVELDDPQTAERIGNKPDMYAAYETLGVSAPPYLVFSKQDEHAALEFMTAQAGACVVKPPRDTGGGQGVTMGVDTPEKLARAVSHTATYCDDVMIEAEIEGAAYRLLYLDGEWLDTVRRDPPHVTGDGTSSVRDLVKLENAARRNASPITALSLLTIDGDMTNTLTRTGRNLATVPKQGERIRLKGACNQNAARENHHCTSGVHPQTEAQIQTILQHFGVRFAGIDLICHDITALMSPENGYIFEVNTYPGLHHHFLAQRETRPDFITDKVITALMSKNG